jgi:hypothetical protein
MSALALAAALAAAAAPPAATPYATATAALHGAVRAAVAQARPHAHIGDLGGVLCPMPVAATETTVCSGAFSVYADHRHPGVFYDLTSRSTARWTAPGTIAVAFDARAISRRVAARRGHLPARITGARTLSGPPPPAERTVHADVVLEHGAQYGQRRLSRDRWLGFAVPFFYRQAFAEGPVTLPGAVDHVFDLPPGAACDVQASAGARVTSTGPRELPGGKLLVDPVAQDDGAAAATIAVRSGPAADGAITYTLAGVDGQPPSLVRVQPAPSGLAPAALGTLVVTAAAETDLQRFGQPGPDGYPLLDPLPAQVRACAAAARDTATALLPRMIATASISARPRPPRADPDDEAPTPVEPKSYERG